MVRRRCNPWSLLMTLLRYVLFMAAAAPWVLPAVHGLAAEVSVFASVTVRDTGAVAIPLAALGRKDGSPVVQLIWAQDATGGFPVWYLYLASSEEILPEGMPVKPGVGTLSESAVELARITPTRGHTYEAVLSYAPAQGALDVRLRDVEGGRVLYASSFFVPEYEEPLSAVTGIGQPGYVPVGAAWALGTREASGTFLSMYAFETRSEEALLRIHTPGPLPPGTYMITLEHGDAAWHLATVQPRASETFVSIPLSECPLGTLWLRVDYVSDGRSLLADRRPVTVGRVEVAFDRSSVERETRLAATTARLRSAEPLAEEVRMTLSAAMRELRWNAETRSFERPVVAEHTLYRGPVDLSQGQADVQPSVPLPDRPGSWELYITPAVEPHVPLFVSGQTLLVSTYEPARIADGEPYTIVVYPDTQYFTRHSSEVMTRMSNWVAAHAAELNIAAVLHVGDITDRNVPAQWLNAYLSMSLLHDVVPCVVSIGNHDMVEGAVRDRSLTRLNDFFTVAAAQRYANLGGTLKPGRLDNHYALFSLGGTDYLIVSLEYLPPDEALVWANEVVAGYPSHRVIYLTHPYLTHAGTKSGRPANEPLASVSTTTVNTSFEIWSELVRRHPNSFLILCGHASPQNVTVPYYVERTDFGRPVPALLFDYQYQPNGGDGWLGLLTFRTDSTVEVQVYSPYLGVYADEIDPNGFTSYLLIDTVTGKVSRLYQEWNLDQLSLTR